MTTRPSAKMLASLIGAGVALALALWAAAMMSNGTNSVLAAILLVLGSVAAIILLWFALAAQSRRERSTLQKIINQSARSLETALMGSAAGAQEHLGETLDLLRAQKVETKNLALTVGKTHELAAAGDSRLRTALQFLRSEARERGEADTMLGAHLNDMRRGLETLSQGMSTAGQNATDTAHAVRRVQNFLRKEGNIQVLLDRFIASERRTLGAVETARLELRDEIARAADAQAELRDVLDTRLRDLKTGTEAYERTRAEELALHLGELQRVLGGRMKVLEDAGAEHSQASGTILQELQDAGGRGSAQASEIVGSLSSLRDEMARFDEAQGRTLQETKALLALTQALHSEFEESASQAVCAAVASSKPSQEIIATLEHVASDIKETVTSTGKAGTAEVRQFSQLLNDRTQRHMKRETIEGVRQTEALLQLLERIDTSERRFPTTGWWALAADSLLYLSDYIQEAQPRRVIEIGSGASTVWLGTFAQRVGAEYISLEHDADFVAQTQRLITEHGLADTVRLFHAPLVPTVIDGQEYQWYDQAVLENIGEEFDLLIVDGPPEATGPMARYPAMPILVDRLSAQATVVLDDVHREAEADALKQWSERFEGFDIAQTGLSRTGIMVRSAIL